MVRFFRITIVIIILLFLGGFFMISAEYDLQSELIQFLEKLETAYIWIVLIIFGLTLFSTLAGLPVLYLGVALGVFIPYLPAVGIAWFISLISVMTTFYMVKSVFSRNIKERYGSKKMMKKINKRIKKYGLWTVALSRSIYIIPTNIINFSFPLSRITLRQYFNGTMMGLIPESFINVTTGYLLKNQIILLTAPQKDLVSILISTAALAVIALVIVILYYRKRKVKKARINDIIPPLNED
ncbi:MAG: VTT domain-containing protein [Bacteroidales bacterium]|nr:VTT domain-containing protein [Bacteroidales bacterium]